MITASLHQPVEAQAEATATAAWVTIQDDEHNLFTIFLPRDKAVRIAAIINGEPEPEEP